MFEHMACVCADIQHVSNAEVTLQDSFVCSDGHCVRVGD